MRILVTGGAGYIGSHACRRLLGDGHAVVALDDLSRGHRVPMDLLAAQHPETFAFVRADLGDRAAIRAALETHEIDTVMHFGALAYVGESVEHPLRYYEINVGAALRMLDAIDTSDAPVERFIFSSSCATYGDPPEGMIPVPEHCPQRPTSPYGRTKLFLEQILSDFAIRRAREGRPIALSILRYFNVAGASGELGEDHDPETHLIPIAIRAAQSGRGRIEIFGTDLPTPDGTCVRDFVHVEDLVAAHALAMERVAPGRTEPFNIGTGRGHSVREVLDAVRRVSGRDFEVIEAPRRPGDAVALWADPTRIGRELGWSPRAADLDAIVRSAWDWFEAHPRGYEGGNEGGDAG